MRKKLLREKLIPCSSKAEKDLNVLWKMVNADDSDLSPITASGCYGVLASFREGDTTNDIAKLMSVHGEEGGLTLYATAADREALVKGLKWLDPQATILPEASVAELSDQFLSCLNDSPIPNGSVESMTEFIKSRTWDEKHLWGGTMEEFWKMLDCIVDQAERWRILRQFITYNMAWQTKLIWYPCDALHRVATYVMSFNGVCLPDSPEELQEAVTAYAKMLVPVDETHPRLCKRRKDGNCNVIDGEVQLLYCIPSQTSLADWDFYQHMRSISAHSQHDSGLLTSHNVLNVLDIVLSHFKHRVAGQLRYLYYSGERSRGIEATLCGLTTMNEFRDLLVTEGLCNTDRHTDSWDTLWTRINACDKFKTFYLDKDENKEKMEYNWSDIYISVWVEKFSKVAYKALKETLDTDPVFGMIDTNLGLDKISEMSQENFQRMFKHCSGTNYKEEEFLSSFLLDPEHLPQRIILNAFNKKYRLDVVAGDPYKKFWKKEVKGSYFSPSLLEFVWLLMYAHFSEGSFNSISNLTNPPTYNQVTTSNDEIKSLSRRFLRCVVFSISISHNSSARIWQGGYFPRDRTSDVRDNKMSKGTQKVFLMMSAISETCSFFAQLGTNPNIPMMAPISDWVDSSEYDLKIFEKSLRDPVFMFTFFFCQQVNLQEEKWKTLKSKDFKVFCCDLIDATLRRFPGLSFVTSLKRASPYFLGNYTDGAQTTLSLSPDPAKLPQLSKEKGHLLVVIGDERYSQIQPPESYDVPPQDRPITHSISQFASWSLHYPSLFELLEKYSEKNESHNTQQVEVEAVAEVNPVSYNVDAQEVARAVQADAQAEVQAVDAGSAHGQAPDMSFAEAHVQLSIGQQGETAGGGDLSDDTAPIAEVLDDTSVEIIKTHVLSAGAEDSSGDAEAAAVVAAAFAAEAAAAAAGASAAPNVAANTSVGISEGVAHVPGFNDTAGPGDSLGPAEAAAAASAASAAASSAAAASAAAAAAASSATAAVTAVGDAAEAAAAPNVAANAPAVSGSSRTAILAAVAAESITWPHYAVAPSRRANDQVMEGADISQPPRKRRKRQGSPTEEGGRSGEGRKPRKKSRKGEEDEENQSDSQPTAKQAAVAVEGKKGPITLNDVSEALKKFAPKVIDLTNEGNVNEEEIEKNFSELDEVAKTQCLLVFFKLWTRCNEIDKSNKRKEAWKSHPYVDDEAACDDMKDDEGEFLENEEDHHFIDHEHVDDEGYNPNHRNIPDEMRGQPQGESDVDSGDDISALTLRNGPHYVGEGPLSPTGGYESDSISARRRQSQRGKTPEDERDDEGERNFIDH